MLIKKKKFHLSDVLSITTGRLLSTRHMEGIYDILNYMTGRSLYTHEIPLVIKTCELHLLEKFPELKQEDGDGFSADNMNEWIADKVNKYGEWFEVERIENILK